MKKIIALIILLVAAISTEGCQGTTTARPQLTKAEIQEEALLQKELASEEKYQAPEKILVTKEMKERFKKIAVQIGVAGEDLCTEIGGKKCKFGFELSEKAELNAHADGKKVVIYAGMIDFAKTDTELATVMAHEYAHNVMNHVSKTTQNVAIGSILGALADAALSSQGVSTGGVGQQIAGNYALMKYSPEFEHEADYVGLYILQRAGYDISTAPNFWRRMSIADKRGIYTRTTHPTNPERYVEMSKTIKEINEKKAAGQPIVPSFKKPD